MTAVNVTKTIKVTAKDAWETISSFEGIEKFSPVARSVKTGEGVGALRSCFMPDDAEIKEELTGLNNEKMHLQYIITSGPFPFTDYVSDVLVKEVSETTCEVSWSSQFIVNEGVPEAAMVELLEGFYNAIMQGLEELVPA
ncbi:SRPBCC family protein [Urechidicola vernalis]|uniref:SRPBCC family protein n=1 Tax=Urechidicola vernalis TaxID=3075600 RepID=A0ABU2Y7B8_9FLAO|nr:SRPBCC family protein [Urechidicola sp. P050]MDT0554086.1 SRPBCC family protein [Urechidicola sp. P050]